ncbi:cold shock domain-containing protein [Candidatus Daviesbacteria bacterium]|nr:cold shock domain-containing protein [Candidatus Daviesbacteria bacterium]
MAETGTVKFYREDRGYGFIVPDSGGRDVYFRLEAVRVPRVDLESGVFGWDYPKVGEVVSPNEQQALDGGVSPRVVFVRVVSANGDSRAVGWAYLEVHENAVDALWHLMAKFRFPSQKLVQQQAG